MKYLIGLLFLFLLTLSVAYGQEIKFIQEISNDTILMENNFELRYTVENVNGVFEAPDLDNFHIVSGPNTSSSIQIVNGEMSSKTTYRFLLAPKDLGNYYIGEAFLVCDNATYTAQAMEIIVLPNPDGIKQDHSIKLKNEYIFEGKQPEKPKKKIKAKRHKI